jgi:hypothetical protein
VELPLFWIVVHYFADFHFQSHWMAINKSKRWDALALHCAVYSVFWLFLGWTFALITFVLHFLTDAVTSRITSRLWFFEQQPGLWVKSRSAHSDYEALRDPFLPVGGENRPHWFFTVIGIDQVLHYTALTLTGYWLGILS